MQKDHHDLRTDRRFYTIDIVICNYQQHAFSLIRRAGRGRVEDADQGWSCVPRRGKKKKKKLRCGLYLRVFGGDSVRLGCSVVSDPQYYVVSSRPRRYLPHRQSLPQSRRAIRLRPVSGSAERGGDGTETMNHHQVTTCACDRHAWDRRGVMERNKERGMVSYKTNEWQTKKRKLTRKK